MVIAITTFTAEEVAATCRSLLESTPIYLGDSFGWVIMRVCRMSSRMEWE